MTLFRARTFRLNLPFSRWPQPLANSYGVGLLATLEKSLQQAAQLCGKPSASLKLNGPLARAILCPLQKVDEDLPLAGTSPLLLAFASSSSSSLWKRVSAGLWAESLAPALPPHSCSLIPGGYFLVVHPARGSGGWLICLTGNQMDCLTGSYIFIS